MFHKLVCLLLLAFFNIMYCVSPPFIDDSTGRTTTTQAVKYSQNVQEIYNNQHKLHSGPGSKQVHKVPERFKRGIVLIDEDFNVKPDTRIMKDRNDKGAFDSKVDSTLKTTPKTYLMSEGSGSSETMSDELLLIRSVMTPRNVKMTRLLDQKTTTVVGGNISVKKSTRFAAPDNLQIPRLFGQEATTADEDIEASGDDDSFTVIDSSRTSIDEDTSSPKYTTPSTSTENPGTTSVTKNEDISSKHTSPSTDEGLEKITSSEDKDTSSSHIADVTGTSTNDMLDVHKDLCLNITCDSKDLLILPNLSKAVPEGTNLTISCILPNATEQGLLKWYKYNSSDLLLLEEKTGDHSVHFAITSTVLHHTGTYICYKFTEQLCCSKKLEITVYKVPNYKKHFFVIGGIAAASLLLCTLIGICKCMKSKNYEKKVDLQNVEKPFLL